VIAASDKPVMFWSYRRPGPECVALLARAGIPCFTSVTGIACAARALINYHGARTRFAARAALPIAPNTRRRVLPFKPGRDAFCEYELAPLLADYGVRTSSSIAHDEQIAVDLAKSLIGLVAM
jgi:hypothetical protein